MADGRTPYEKRFGEPFGGPIIPFGAECNYQPITAKDKQRLHAMGLKELSGIFVGYDTRVGGGWSSDLLVIDREELGNAENASDVYIKRFEAREVKTPKINGDFRFPVADGSIQVLGYSLPRSLRRKTRRVNADEDEEESDAGGDCCAR